MPNPDHKRRSDGKLLGGKNAQRTAKTYKATGKVTSTHKEAGKGSSELTARRIWRMLFGDDDK
jgi:hypothetical protein